MSSLNIPEHYQIPDGSDPDDPEIIHIVLEQVIAKLQSFDRQELAEEFARRMARYYPSAWDAYCRPANVERVMFGIRSIATRTRMAFRQQAIFETAEQRLAHKMEPMLVANAFYVVSDGRWARLINMTKKDVLSTAHHCENIAKGQMRRAAILRRIAARLPDDDSLVSDFFSVEALQQLGLADEAMPDN